jgi:hypothetical protein
MSRRKRRVLAALAGVVLALGGWWAVRGPAIERHPATPAPYIDIDPPAMRARREATRALATAPEDPWTFAESLAASAPASAAEPAAESECGLDDGPQFRKQESTEDASVQTRAPSTRYLNAQARIDAALRTSADPMDRAAADLLNVGDMRTPAGGVEAVVQQAATTTDPRVYALGYGLCHRTLEPTPSCRSLSAQGWARMDPGNGIPWVDVLAQAQAGGDPAGMRDAIAHLAAATRFDTYFLAMPGAIASRVAGDEQALSAADELVTRAVGQASALPVPPFQPLIQACRHHAGGNEALAQQCRVISDAMYEHSDTLILQSISGALLQQTTGDASRRDLVRAERAKAAAHWSPATGFSECRVLRDAMKRIARSAQLGEVEALRELARSAVTP